MDSIFKVGKWIIRPQLCEIQNEEKTLRLEPKSMDLLLLLAQANGELVTRQEIMDIVWKDRVVTEYALNNLISGLRKQLNTKGEKEAYIATRPKLGYQLIANVEKVNVSTPGFDTLDQKIQDSANTPPLQSNEAIQGATELTNKTRKPIALLAFIALSLIVVSVLITNTMHNSTDRFASAEPSIVVLPFDVFDSEEDISYFADGLAEEIIHQLTVLPNFKVISRTSSFYFRDKDLPLSEIAKRLDVEYVLEGSVRKERETMRVTLQLIEAASDTHVWSKVFTANRQNRFSIQFEISSEVAHSIDASFADFPEDKRLYTPGSSEAYLRVLKGRKLNQEGTADAYVQALEEFRMATLLEPEYAEAYADLAMSYLLLVSNKRLTLEEINEKVDNALNRALELNPNLASAIAVRAYYLQFLNKWPEAKETYEKAINIDPKNYVALVNYANLHRRASNYDTAIEYYERAKKIAPTSGAVYWGISNANMNSGNFDDALKQLEKCVLLLSSNLSCHYEYAYLLRLTGQTDKANVIFEKITELANRMDFTYRSVTGFHNLWQQKFEASNAMYDGLTAQFGLNNDIVMSMPEVKLALNTIEPWTARLEELIQTQGNKAYAAVHAGFATSAYYTNQCSKAIPSLEKIKTHRYSMMTNILYYAHGTSFLNILAHCYDAEGRHQERDEIIAEIKPLFDAISNNENYVGGWEFVKAQYSVLSGDVEGAQAYIDNINQNDWAFAWLIEKDPILMKLSGSDIEQVNSL